MIYTYKIQSRYTLPFYFSISLLPSSSMSCICVKHLFFEMAAGRDLSHYLVDHRFSEKDASHTKYCTNATL